MKHRPVDSDEVRRLLTLVNESRDRTFETRNILDHDAERLAGMAASWQESGPGCVPMDHDELQKATYAAYKAAEEAAKAQTLLHRNLMTLLGYRTVAEERPEAQPIVVGDRGTERIEVPDIEQTQVIPVVQ